MVESKATLQCANCGADIIIVGSEGGSVKVVMEGETGFHSAQKASASGGGGGGGGVPSMGGGVSIGVSGDADGEGGSAVSGEVALDISVSAAV